MASNLNMVSDSVTDPDESSDIVYDSPCKPCFHDDKNIEGDYFCVQCQTFFCQTCVGHHNRCFKTHCLFNKTSARSQNLQQKLELMCEKHPGNSIQMYCGEHDVVTCAVCVAVDHRLCKGVDYIPKLAKEILNGRDRKDVKTSLEKLSNEMNAVKASKLEQIRQVSSEKEHIVNEINSMAERVIARVRKLEGTSVNEVKTRYDNIVERINNDIEPLDDMLTSTYRHIKNIDQFKGDNEAKLFVVLNKAHEIESKCKKYIHADSKVLHDKISFQINQDIESILNGLESLEMSNDCDTDYQCMAPIGSEATLVGQCTITDDCSSNFRGVTDSCIQDNGHIVIADSYNFHYLTDHKYIKRLDKTYAYKDCLELGNVSGLCNTGPTELAFIVNGSTIQFVLLGKSMVKQRSFAISHAAQGQPLEFDLRHIAFNDKKLYFCPRVYQNSNGNDVWVYDVRGRHLQTVRTGMKTEAIGEVNHFSISSDGARLLFATSRMGLITLSVDGTVLSQVMDERLQNVYHVTEGDNGQMYVCGKDSGNVFLLDKDGKIVDEVLGRFNGLDRPQCIMYIKGQKRLLVACEGEDTVKIFQMQSERIFHWTKTLGQRT